MLIVNADDFGASRERVGPGRRAVLPSDVISSASAMVRMRDSARAASLARERGAAHRPAPQPHPSVRRAGGARRRARAPAPPHREFSARESWREDGGESPAGRLLADVIADQLECFRASFGEPSHLDGHHHIHIHPAVLEHLPEDLPIRPILSVPSRADAAARSRASDGFAALSLPGRCALHSSTCTRRSAARA